MQMRISAESLGLLLVRNTSGRPDFYVFLRQNIQMITSTLSSRPWHAATVAAGIPTELPALQHQSIAALVHTRCSYFSGLNPKQKAFTCVMPNGMNGSLTFGQIDALSDAFAGYLRSVLNLQAGDRVAVQLPNSSPCSLGGAAIRPRLTGVNPNSAEIRSMISAWRLAIAT